jgi:thiol-disulfide isomerase/thioredoxin
MASRVTIRPRLLAIALAIALVVSVAAGFGASRLLDDDDGVDARLDEPGVYTEPTDAAQPVTGDAFPDVEVLDLDGNTVRTGALVGQPMVVNLWYSTCAPCKRELPAFAEVSAEYDGTVRFVGINPVDPPDTLLDFARDKGVRYENYRDEIGSFTEAIRAVGFPMTVFVSADGTVVDQSGVLDAGGLRSRIEDSLL